MSKMTMCLQSLGRCLMILWMLVATACGSKSSTEDVADEDNVHINFLVRPSTMLLGVTDAQISEITIQRSNCPDGSEPLDYQLAMISSDKSFVLNEERKTIEQCMLQLRAMTLSWKELTITYTLFKEQQTSAKTWEAVLANPSKSAFLSVSMPYQLGSAIDRNVYWSVNVSYLDDKMRLYPSVAEARETNVDSLGLSISSLEDRGVLNSIWREFGVSLSCGARQSLGSCNGYDLIGLTARVALQSDVDATVAQQIRYQGSLNDLLFTAGLTHLVGTGLRFTIAMPTSYFGQKLYLIVMRGQGYSVFDIQPGTIPPANR